MVSDKENIEAFDKAANNPELWRLRGHDLHTAAQILRGKAVEATSALTEDDWSSLPLDDPRIQDVFKFAGIVFQAAMFQGFAIECLLKRYWIAKGNQVSKDGKYKIEVIVRENHDLAAIATAVGFPLSTDEATALSKLSEYVRSFGRYPIAKTWLGQRLQTNEHGIAAAPEWSVTEHDLAETVLLRLKSAAGHHSLSQGP